MQQEVIQITSIKDVKAEELTRAIIRMADEAKEFKIQCNGPDVPSLIHRTLKSLHIVKEHLKTHGILIEYKPFIEEDGKSFTINVELCLFK